MKEITYKLLKDLPDLPAGAVFTYDRIFNAYTHSRNGGDGNWVYSFDEESINRNPTWWKIKN